MKSKTKHAAAREAATLSGTNLERAGDYNQRVIFQAVRVHGPLTRADLSEITGLTSGAVANITKRLVDQGLILEAGRLHGLRGQPAMRLAVNPDGRYALGVNIDRDHVTLVVLDLTGQVRARASREMNFALPQEVTAFFREQTKTMLGRGRIPKERILGVGVAIPDDLGRVNLPHRPASYEVWNDTDIASLFKKTLNAPVLVENDAIAAAIGEAQFGHGLNAPSFFYALISAGLGGGLVIERNYYRGATGRSGELGFLPLRDGGDGRQSLQDVVSLSAVYQMLEEAGLSITAPEQLTTLERRGARIVDEWIERASQMLVEPFVSINCLINPDAIFLGGRLPLRLLDRLAERTAARLAASAPAIPGVAPVRRAALAADAPAIGAAILPLQASLFPSREALMKTAVASGSS